MKDTKKHFENLLKEVVKEFNYDITTKCRKREYIDVLDAYVYTCATYFNNNLSNSKLYTTIGNCVNRDRVTIIHSYKRVAENEYRYKELKSLVFKIVQMIPKDLCNYSEENIKNLIDYHTKEIEFLSSKLLKG